MSGINTKWVSTSQVSWTISLTLLVTPYLFELFYFVISTIQLQKITSDKNQTKKMIQKKLKEQNMWPTIDFFLDAKEMFFRIICLWVSIPIIYSIVLISKYFTIDTNITHILCILVFSFYHFKFDKYAFVEREKIFDAYTTSANKKII